jgi:hypothetical protein
MHSLINLVGRQWPWFNRMTYHPFKGAHRGYWYRLPWNKELATNIASM